MLLLAIVHLIFPKFIRKEILSQFKLCRTPNCMCLPKIVMWQCDRNFCFTKTFIAEVGIIKRLLKF